MAFLNILILGSFSGQQNHLNGADITSNCFDFAKRLKKTKRVHTATPPGGSAQSKTILEEYVFDHAGRIRFVRHKINPNNWVVISAPLYDEMGRLQDKRLHANASTYNGTDTVTLNSNFNYLQSVDYAYNIRGWLTAINNNASCAIVGNDNLADLFALRLDYESTANGASPQYNGNIAASDWRVNINGVCGTRHQYRFTYDFANRLKGADHYTNTGTWVFTNDFTESNISYDLNGNILTYTRRDRIGGVPSVIDQLTYTYSDVLRPDRLTRMADTGLGNKGFMQTGGLTGDHYLYDANGNLTQDKHKVFAFTYNHLNLPVTMTKGSNVITMTYTADGEKLSKAVTGGPTKSYMMGIEYSGSALEANSRAFRQHQFRLIRLRNIFKEGHKFLEFLLRLDAVIQQQFAINQQFPRHVLNVQFIRTEH